MTNIFEYIKKYKMGGGVSKAEYISGMYQFHGILLSYSKLIKDTDIEKIEISADGTFVLLKNGIKLFVREKDERTVPIEIINFGSYEKEEWKQVLTFLNTKNPETIFDIGGNIGYISLLLKKAYPNAEIHTFEPIHSTFDVLKKNCELNDCELKINECGLSDKSGYFTYYFYPEDSGNSSMRNLSNRESVEEIKAEVKTLDSYVEENGVENIDFMKIDVEGAEFSVLKGGAETLKKYHPIMFVELLRKWSAPFGYKPQDVIDYLKDFGYNCYVFSSNTLKEIDVIDENTVETNFLFM